MRAAVIGGSGFGRFHAQWYAREGLKVVGFTCTTADSVESATEAIRLLTRQEPRGYVDPVEMLETERPEIVSVCAPPDRHLDPVLTSLSRNAHVYCEKPLLYSADSNSSEILSQADRMVTMAQHQGRMLAVNHQYAALVASYLEMFHEHGGELETIDTFLFDMESKGNRHGVHRFEQLWVELGPHALTPLLSAFPSLDLDAGSLCVSRAEREIRVEARLNGCARHPLKVQLRTGSCGKDATPVRRMGFNGYLVDIQARKDSAGVFQTCLKPVDGGEERIIEDLMQVSIRRFVRATQGDGAAYVDGAAGRRNLSLLLQVLDALRAAS